MGEDMAIRIELRGDDKPIPTIPLSQDKVHVGFFCDTCHDFIAVVAQESEQEVYEIVADGALLIECAYCGARTHRGLSDFHRRSGSDAWKHRGSFIGTKPKKPKSDVRLKRRNKALDLPSL
jgi:hypothetical protein